MKRRKVKNKIRAARLRRARRTHYKIRKMCIECDRHRLSISVSNVHIGAQIIDDKVGHTLVSVNTLTAASEDNKRRNMSNRHFAAIKGLEIAEKAKEKGISKVIFDTGKRKYHGVVKEFAEAARKGGLDF